MLFKRHFKDRRRDSALAGRLSTGIVTLVGLAGFLFLQTGIATAQLAIADKALKKGNFQQAVRAYTSAMTKEDLKPGQTALVLVNRAKAYLNVDRPADAIADITKAIWLNKLSRADKARALAIRAESFREVSMVGLANKDRLASKGNGNGAAFAGISGAGPVPPAVSAPRKHGGATSRKKLAGIPSFQTTVTRKPTSERSQAIRKPVTTSSLPTATAAQSEISARNKIPAFRTTIQPVAQAPSNLPRRTGGAHKSSNSVAGFFGGLFSGSKKQPKPATPAQTAPATVGNWSTITTTKTTR